MIVRILGGNGAGKSYIVHQVLKLYGHLTVSEKHIQCEKGKSGMQNVFVPGHYRIANGGLDTVPSGPALTAMRERMIAHMDGGWHVLYEVSAQKEGSDWMIDLNKRGYVCRPILLDTSDNERVISVRARGHNIREDLIRKSGRKAEKIIAELSFEMPVLVLSREAALHRVTEHLMGAS